MVQSPCHGIADDFRRQGGHPRPLVSIGVVIVHVRVKGRDPPITLDRVGRHARPGAQGLPGLSHVDRDGRICGEDPQANGVGARFPLRRGKARHTRPSGGEQVHARGKKDDIAGRSRNKVEDDLVLPNALDLLASQNLEGNNSANRAVGDHGAADVVADAVDAARVPRILSSFPRVMRVPRPRTWCRRRSWLCTLPAMCPPGRGGPAAGRRASLSRIDGTRRGRMGRGFCPRPRNRTTRGEAR